MQEDDRKMLIATGNSNIPLAEEISQLLNRELLKPIMRFRDGEIRVNFGGEEKDSLRGKHVFVIQPTCKSTYGSINDSIMELLLMINAARGASAKIVTAVTPYFGYARQDKKVEPRAPISAKLMAELLQEAGANRVLVMDLHANQIQGFFDLKKCLVDHLYAKPIFINYLKQRFGNGNFMIATPDTGGADRARSYAKKLGARLAVADKRREEANKIKGMQIIGNVKGQRVILIDDILDTFGTMREAVRELVKKGAAEVHIIATHPVLSKPAIKRIKDSPVTSLAVTNTIPLSREALACKKINVISVAAIFAEAIERIYKDESVSALFV